MSQDMLLFLFQNLKELLKMIVGHTANTDTYGTYGHKVDGDLQRTADIFDNVFTRILQ
mgnify:CR=1 FL=1